MRNGHQAIPILAVFAGVWLVWFSAAGLVPFTYERGSWMAAGLLSAFYVLGTGALALWLGRAVPPAARVVAELPRTRTNAMRYALIGVAGSGLLVFDRVVVQGIDLRAGLAAARTEWAVLGETREGISSIYSAAGNLLWAFAFVGLAYGFVYFEALRRAGRWPVLTMAVSLAGIFAVSILNGGRMPIIFAVALLVSLGAVRKAIGLPVVPRVSNFSKLTIAAVGATAVAYAGYVLIDRATANSFDLDEYAQSSAEYLHGVPRDEWLEKRPGPVAAVAALSTAQLVHQFWVFQLTIDEPRREGSLLLSTPIYLLQKLGFFRGQSADWTHAGLYLSLPGAAYHDGGVPGLVLLVVFHGIALGACTLLLQRLTPVRLLVVILVFITTVLSPLLPAFVAAPFPFMAVALVLPCLKFSAARLREPAPATPAGPLLP